MKPLLLPAAASLWLAACPVLAQEPAQPQPIEAKKEVIVKWTLGDQVWDFSQVESVYEPIKGVLDPQKRIAFWTLELKKELLPGVLRLHADYKGTPFRPVLLSAEKTVIANDADTFFTTLLSDKAGDNVVVAVQLPDAETLAHVKTIRVERRTNVGF